MYCLYTVPGYRCGGYYSNRSAVVGDMYCTCRSTAPRQTLATAVVPTRTLAGIHALVTALVTCMYLYELAVITVDVFCMLLYVRVHS